jgi:hypothetical protein
MAGKDAVNIAGVGPTSVIAENANVCIELWTCEGRAQDGNVQDFAPGVLFHWHIVGIVRTLAHYTHDPVEIVTAMNQRMIGRGSGGFTTALVLRLDPDGTLRRSLQQRRPLANRTKSRFSRWHWLRESDPQTGSHRRSGDDVSRITGNFLLGDDPLGIER